MKNFVFTSESVCAGHPDKVADQISDALVDAVLAQDPNGKVAIETLVTKDCIVLAGETKSKAKIDPEKIAREQIKRLGYTLPELDFTDTSPITLKIHAQSPEIATGVEKKGAGDQGMMFGFAVDETEELMPLPITLAHTLARKIDEARIQNLIPHLRPDGKTQVTLEYKNNIPVKVKSVILAIPHSEKSQREEILDGAYEKIVAPVLGKYNLSFNKKDVILNGTGVWHYSGPAADTGVTGRKIIVDTYGGYARVGGGAFSGKDPTKVDRSAAYAARFLAKNIVAQKLAKKVEVSLAFFIGAHNPTMLEIETFGTEKKSHKTILDFASGLLDCSVQGILDGLSLRRPIYLPTAAYGHFGNPLYPWEQII